MKRKFKKDFVCPIAAGADPWEGECEFVNDFHCPHASLAHMRVAVAKNLSDCPYKSKETKISHFERSMLIHLQAKKARERRLKENGRRTHYYK